MLDLQHQGLVRVIKIMLQLMPSIRCSVLCIFVEIVSLLINHNFRNLDPYNLFKYIISKVDVAILEVRATYVPDVINCHNL